VQSIEALDRQAMALIEKQDAAGFARYMRETRNTICGAAPIAVLLRMLAAANGGGGGGVPGGGGGGVPGGGGGGGEAAAFEVKFVRCARARVRTPPSAPRRRRRRRRL